MLLLVQIAIILALSRVVRRLVLPLGQPAVIGEMMAGLMLGPSCFGWLLPRWSASLFPPASLDPLNNLSQLGLILFMFIVGTRVGSQSLRANRGVAMVVSLVSIVVPFALGAALAWTTSERLAPAGVGVLPFTLFIGAAMSITAFPVLARILADQGLLTSDIGMIAIACAAFDDVTGWLILAGILSLVQANAPELLVMRAALLVAYLAIMVAAVRPALAWIERLRLPSGARLAVMLLVALLSAAATDALGVHALFGAFFAGLMAPRSEEIEATLARTVEPVTAVLLPLFFAFTGLRTSVGLIDSPSLAGDAAIFLAVAIAGKGGASTLAARAMGIGWRDASVLGALLNTRGLIELVILGIGLEAGILSPTVFSMLVVMAFVTTLMTSPLLKVLRKGSTTENVVGL